MYEYLADEKRNATQAAIRAGYSKTSAKFAACHMLKDPEIQKLINRELTRHLKQLDIDAQMVLKGINDAIEDAKRAGQGAWQSQAVLRGYELLGKSMGLFVDRVESNLDEKIMETLIRGRRRAAGLKEDEEEQPQDDDAELQKPN